MVTVRSVDAKEKALIKDIVNIHIRTFEHFFLTFMNKGFLKTMYRSYCENENAELLVENGIGIMLEKGDALTGQVSDLLSHPEKLTEMRENCRRYVRKDSCANIYALAKELAGNTKFH